MYGKAVQPVYRTLSKHRVCVCVCGGGGGGLFPSTATLLLHTGSPYIHLHVTVSF